MRPAPAPQRPPGPPGPPAGTMVNQRTDSSIVRLTSGSQPSKPGPGASHRPPVPMNASQIAPMPQRVPSGGGPRSFGTLTLAPPPLPQGSPPPPPASRSRNPKDHPLRPPRDRPQDHPLRPPRDRAQKSSNWSLFSSLLGPWARPVQACNYVPDESDDIDLLFSAYLEDLRPEAASQLTILRLKSGSYEIGGRAVTLVMTDSNVWQDGELVVCESDMDDPNEYLTLDTYLEQAAHVAVFLDNKPQHKKDLTFGDARIPDNTDPFTARLMCMRIACDQAEMRQAHQDSFQVSYEEAAANSLPRPAQSNQPRGDTTYVSPTVIAEMAPRQRSLWERLTGRGVDSEDEDEDM